MFRIIAIAVLAYTLFAASGMQDRPPSLPPGPAPGPADQSWLATVLLVQANMIEGGDVMFLAPLSEEDPNKIPPPPAIFAKIDGKAVKAFGTDRKKLEMAELYRRLSLRSAAVVVYGQPPDPFFLKALNERTVVFVVPRKIFDQMANSVGEESIQGWWTVMKSTGAAEEPTSQAWVIDQTKIQLRKDEKTIIASLTYKIDADSRSIDLIPETGPAKGKTLKGIYELDGLTLKICHVSPESKEPQKAERPKELGEPSTVTVNLRRVLP